MKIKHFQVFIIFLSIILSSCAHSLNSFIKELSYKSHIVDKNEVSLDSEIKKPLVNKDTKHNIDSKKSLQDLLSEKYSYSADDDKKFQNSLNSNQLNGQNNSTNKDFNYYDEYQNNSYQDTDQIAANFEDLSNDEAVIVKNGLVCVPEKSSNARSLFDILNQELNSDLAESIPSQEKLEKIGSFTIIEHSSIDKWYKYFLNNRNTFQRYLDRGANFKKLVSHVLKEEQLPQELFYLAMIESGFRPTAKSSASAVGIWQFIRGTGKRYGLQINYYIDERKDPVRATRAAARYLEALYRVYQNWELAAAAYNSGENRVLSAIMRGHTRDYWELSRRKLLPRETRDYVPKIMAAIKIGKELEKHGFYFKAKDNYGIPQAANVPGGVRLRDIAKAINSSEKKLKNLNPHLKHRLTPPGKNYKIWVDTQRQSKSLDIAYNKLYKLRQKPASRSNYVKNGYHLVRRGQNLQSISRRYGVSVKKLKQINGIRGSLIYTGQKLKIRDNISTSNIHIVKKGDTLYSISRKYRVSIRDIKRKNRIKGSLVLIGQKIHL